MSHINMLSDSYYMTKVNINGWNIGWIMRLINNLPSKICKRICSYFVPLSSTPIQNLSPHSISWRPITSSYKWRLTIGPQSIILMFKIWWWFGYEVIIIAMKSRWNNFNKIKLSRSNLRVACFPIPIPEAQHDSKRERVTSTIVKAKRQFTHSCQLAMLDYADLEHLNQWFEKLKPNSWFFF